jgi:L-2-hydroxyglutarate oxidase
LRAAIVGGGIVGLATARQLAALGHEVVVLEKEAATARHQSARNSGVVHAGVYYRPGSLKARLCRRGIELLREFCAARGLGYEECGKLIVAVAPRELEPLRMLGERARANGVPGLRWLSERELRAVEPEARGLAALHSPRTAICDFAAVARALAREVEAAGGEVRTGVRAVRVRPEGTVELVAAGAGRRAARADAGAAARELRAERVVVCAGLHADRLARASGQPADPRIVPFRGEYLALGERDAARVRGLIYPVADPELPFLGVHLTRRLDGGVWIGPSAVLALAREGYRRRDLSLRDTVEALAWPGTRRMMRRHWRAGVAELQRSLAPRRMLAEAQRYVPALDGGGAHPAPAGVRAQAIGRDGTLLDDFRLDFAGRVAWVRNAPSPAATSALALAEELAAQVLA